MFVQLTSSAARGKSTIASMPCHPAEITSRDISHMDREAMIQSLLLFSHYCYFQFNAANLARLPGAELRRLLVAARHHYQAKGY